ncbi:MAG: tetratricopeptide repeat protein [Bryobacteraceae bacterium]
MFRGLTLILLVAGSLSPQQRIENDTTSVAARLAKANTDFKAARLAEAKQIAEEILRSEPANATALEIKGNAEYLLGDVSTAIGTFIGLLDQHPENQEAPYMLGRIYYQESMVDEATGQFQRVLKINPRSYKAYDNLGLCYEAKGDNELALRYFLTAIKLVENDHPEYDSAYANLADLLLKTGDAQKAFDAASKATKRNAYSARNFYLGAKALEQLGKFDLSLNWLQRSIALDPNYPEPQYLLSRVYRQLGQKEKAEEARKKFLEARAKRSALRK